MSIAEVGSGSQRASVQGNALPLTRAYPANVTTGSLLVVWAMQAVVGTTPDRFQPGDLTKSAGTATLGPITLDIATVDYGGTTCVDIAVWSCLVTGGGSCTMQINGTTGVAFDLVVNEYSGSWTANRIVDTHISLKYDSDHTSNNVSSTGAALFIGGLATYATGTDVQNVQNSFTTVFEHLTATAYPNCAATHRIVASQTTTAAKWTGGSLYTGLPLCIVYQEGDNAAIYPVGGQNAREISTGVTSRTVVFPNDVTAGDLVVVAAQGWHASSSHTFVAGDCTKSAGSATLGTISIDKQTTVADGANQNSVAIWSAIVTGGGSCTMQVAGMPASSNIIAAVNEIKATAGWDANRVEATNAATGNSGTSDSGNATSAGRALFYGATCANAGNVPIPLHEFALVSKTKDTDAIFLVTGYALAQSGATTSYSNTMQPSDVWADIIVAYKEAAAGGVDATLAATETTDTAALASAATQIAHPTSDIATNSWQASGGGSLYAAIDEVTADDADYIYSPDNPTTQECEVKFGALADPGVHTGHTLHYHLQAMGMDTNFTLTLVQGTTQIDQWIEIVSAADGVVVRSHMMAVAVAANISDYTDLRLRILAAAP